MIYIDTITVKHNTGEQSIDVFLCRPEAQFPAFPCRYFKIDDTIRYKPFCDDFGPMNITSIIRFVELFSRELQECVPSRHQQLSHIAEKGRRGLTNAVFLHGAYKILKHDESPDQVVAKFYHLNPALFENYRDASPGECYFRLTLLDCWRGLARGKQLGWIALPTSPEDSDWGQIDTEMYEHYANPFNGDLHEVVPGKFVAFRGPKKLDGGALYRDDVKDQSRSFDARFYLDILDDFHVSDVVRLNHAEYCGQVFEERGIAHHDLFFEDCTAPPPAVVKRFFAIVDAAKGAVAVHCVAGLGRTGTLAALYLMRAHDFSAREAVAWLRIVRPGSVVGAQQRFLCVVEGCVHTRRASMPDSPKPRAKSALPRSHSWG